MLLFSSAAFLVVLANKPSSVTIRYRCVRSLGQPMITDTEILAGRSVVDGQTPADACDDDDSQAPERHNGDNRHAKDVIYSHSARTNERAMASGRLNKRKTSSMKSSSSISERRYLTVLLQTHAVGSSAEMSVGAAPKIACQITQMF